MKLNLIQKKLGIKTNTSIIFINPPEEFIKQINILPEGANIKKQF